MFVQNKTDLKIIRVPVPTPTLLPHTTTNCYLIGNDQESILVDAGYDLEETRTLLDKVIQDNGLATPNRIVLTHYHPDHAPGVKQLVEWNAAIYCHYDEQKGILEAISPLSQLSFLKDGDIMSVANEEILVIHGPGHTPGHLTLYIPSSQILIAGDNIVAEGTTWIGPPDGDMTDYIQTLKRMRELQLDRIGPGHGEWVDNPYEQIDFVVNRRLQRENQIKALLKEHTSLTSERLTELIYADTIHPSVFKVAKLTIEAHLLKLIKENTVTQNDSQYSINT